MYERVKPEENWGLGNREGWFSLGTQAEDKHKHKSKWKQPRDKHKYKEKHKNEPSY